MRFSIFLISSTFLIHMPKVGGLSDFHSSGIQDFAASNKCRIRDFLYFLLAMSVACNRKKPGSARIGRSVNFCIVCCMSLQNCSSRGQLQKGGGVSPLTLLYWRLLPLWWCMSKSLKLSCCLLPLDFHRQLRVCAGTILRQCLLSFLSCHACRKTGYVYKLYDGYTPVTFLQPKTLHHKGFQNVHWPACLPNNPFTKLLWFPDSYPRLHTPQSSLSQPDCSLQSHISQAVHSYLGYQSRSRAAHLHSHQFLSTPHSA